MCSSYRIDSYHVSSSSWILIFLDFKYNDAEKYYTKPIYLQDLILAQFMFD